MFLYSTSAPCVRFESSRLKANNVNSSTEASSVDEDLNRTCDKTVYASSQGLLYRIQRTKTSTQTVTFVVMGRCLL